MNILDFAKMKKNNQKISMVTCYDFWSAKIISQSNIDCILVGDSTAMVSHGHKSTLPATVEMMASHISAVAKGADNKFIVGDMPFCSYSKGLEQTMFAAERIMQAGSHAIKLEGAVDPKLITHIVNAGIPVMGHLGLTPQSMHVLGGFKVQGKDVSDAQKIREEAKTLQDAGCFAIVLECIPHRVAKEITDCLMIPTIGIGAGPCTSGQVLVLQDLLGCQTFKPKFLKTYMDGFNMIKNALNQYDNEVKDLVFPNLDEHCYETQ
ncbi:MAG: 3-methyl-2-oxobutanoate hydroxymethyltransferase [Gammaproteobacteria bacterium]